MHYQPNEKSPPIGFNSAGLKVNWLIECLIDWLIWFDLIWLIDWLIERLIDWLIDWLIDVNNSLIRRRQNRSKYKEVQKTRLLFFRYQESTVLLSILWSLFHGRGQMVSVLCKRQQRTDHWQDRLSSAMKKEPQYAVQVIISFILSWSHTLCRNKETVA